MLKARAHTVYAQRAQMNGDLERLLGHPKYKSALTDYLVYRLKGLADARAIDSILSDVSAKRLTTSAALDALAAKAKPTSSSGDSARSAARLRDLEPVWPMISALAPKTYLDIGCGNGAITSAIGQKLGLSVDTTIGTDIATWAGHDHKTETSKEITFRVIGEPYAIDAPTSGVDLITVLMVLHHMPADILPKALGEIARILSPGGLVILREHDSPNVMIDSLINVEHAMFEVVLERLATGQSFAKGYIGRYKPKRDWIAVMSSFGFELAGEPIANTRGTRPFYAIFRRRPIAGTVAEASTPELAQMAESMGIPASKARSNAELKQMIASGQREGAKK